uniref:CYCLIN domain-containing protein n=1 Tax=Macrostomum lignano TaxID=282301 RepID=A0A1I8HHI9_9PLAT
MKRDDGLPACTRFRPAVCCNQPGCTAVTSWEPAKLTLQCWAAAEPELKQSQNAVSTDPVFSNTILLFPVFVVHSIFARFPGPGDGGGEGSRRKRRKSSKKFSYRGSYSASSEELANINNSNISNKVQIREQTEVHSVTQLQQVSPPPPPPRSLLPDGLEEGIYRLLDAEMVYHPRTDCLLNNTVCGDDKVNPGLRDEAMFSLRFLHKLHNLAPECFAHAVNITDRFLARVKVKAKYMSCLATAAYLIAARMIEEPENQPSPEKLVRIARCGGSPTDLERMAAIIRVKLRPTAACDPAGIEKPQQLQQEAGRLENAVTPLHFLSLLAPLFNSREQFLRAVGDLETALCSVTVYSCRPALLALCVARRHLLAADAVGAAHSSSMLAVLDAAAQLM